MRFNYFGIFLLTLPNTDESEVKKLHYKYGYYLDKCLYQEVSGLLFYVCALLKAS